jgi:eukaryotic-like serine/threonine-protein kinase
MKTNIKLLSILLCLFAIAWACKKPEEKVTPVIPVLPTKPIETVKSAAKDITKFSFAALSTILNTNIDASLGAITGNVPASYLISQLVPTITISDKATISPATGVAQDFSKEVTYTITAEDGSTKLFKVNINKFDILYIGTIDKKILGIDAITGAKITEFNIGGSVESSPIYANGLIYVGSTDKKIYALDCATGIKKWEFVSNKTFVNDLSYSNNTIFINNDGTLLAIDANNGTKKWAFSKEVDSNPVVENGTVYITNGENEQLFAINETDGSEKWVNSSVGQFEPTYGTNRSIAVKNGIVYVPVNKGIRAVNAINGENLWVNWQPYPINSPTIFNGQPYTTTEREDLIVTKIGGGYDYIVSTKAPKGSSAVISAKLIFTSLNNAHDLKTGSKKWTNIYEKADLYPSLTFANNVLYGGIKNKIYALNADTGKETWVYISSGNILSSPCIVASDGIVYYGGESGMEQ